MLAVSHHAGGAAAPPAAPRRVAAATCIGCGAISSPQECTGACADRRLELVHGADHQRTLAAAGAARHRADTLRAVAAELTGAQPDPGTHAVAFAAVQDLARRLLGSGAPTPELPRAGAVTAWWCTTCGRVEAPQPCLGVCIHQPEELVAADEHRQAAQALEAARRDEREAERLARLVATVTPREGQAGRTWAALRGQALAVL